MNTVDSVFLIITGCAISLFFAIGCVVLIYALKLIKNIRSVISSAEGLIDSVSAATDTLKDIGQSAKGPMAVFKVINNIMKLVSRK